MVGDLGVLAAKNTGSAEKGVVAGESSDDYYFQLGWNLLCLIVDKFWILIFENKEGWVDECR